MRQAPSRYVVAVISIPLVVAGCVTTSEHVFVSPNGGAAVVDEINRRANGSEVAIDVDETATRVRAHRLLSLNPERLVVDRDDDQTFPSHGVSVHVPRGSWAWTGAAIGAGWTAFALLVFLMKPQNSDVGAGGIVYVAPFVIGTGAAIGSAFRKEDVFELR